MGKSTILSVLALTLSILVGNSAQADVVYSTNFNSPTYSDGPIIGQDDWVITGTSVVNPINVANTGSDGNVTLTTTGQDVRRAFTPQSAVALTSITLRADILVTATQATGDYFIHLGNNNTSEFFARVYARNGSAAGFYQLAMGTSSGTAGLVWGADLAINSLATIDARYDIVSGALNDTGALFVNGGFYVNATTTGTDATTFSSVHLRQGTASNAATVTIDNITVTAIPEPATALLLGIGFAGMVIRRRK